MSACALSAPTSGPAGNFILNVSTTVTKPAFSVSSGTVSGQLSLPYITSGQCTQVNSAGQVIGVPCGSGNASVAVTTGTGSGFASIASSPTAVVNFDSSTFNASLKGAATVYIQLNGSSVTLQGNNLSATYLANSSATANYLQLSSAAVTYVQASSASATYFNRASILPIANGGTGTSTPGLIAGTNITSITGSWPNQTINATAGAGAVSPVSLTAANSSNQIPLSVTQNDVTNNPNVIVVTSTGTGFTKFIGNGRPSGGEQNQAGAVTIYGPNYPSDSGFSPADLVIVDSTTNNTNGAGLLELWEMNPNHDSYLLWIHGDSNRNSDEPIRFDGPTFGIDEVSMSTGIVGGIPGTHGEGKWKVISQAYQTINLQLASNRAYDNTTFENELYVVPSPRSDQQAPGLWLTTQDLTDDSGILSSSDTLVYGWNTLNGHRVGLTSPQNPTASWTFALPSTFNNKNEILYQSDNGRGNNNNARSWAFSGTDFEYSPTGGVSVSSETALAVTISTLSIVNQIQTQDGHNMMSGFNTSGCFSAGYASPIVKPGICSGDTNIGYGTGNINDSDGGNNTAIGGSALSGTTGSNNTAIGANDLFTGGLTGSDNTAVGSNISSNTGSTARDNTLLGYSVTSGLTTGTENTIVGSFAASALTTGSSNTIVGMAAGYGNDNQGVLLSSAVVSGNGNTFVGYQAGTSTSAVINNSIAIGYGATVVSSNTTSIGNTSMTLFREYGHLSSSGTSTSPSPSSCGSGSPSVIGTDTAGTIMEGTGSPTGCTLTFVNPWLSTPFCIVQTTSTVTTAAVTSISKTQLTIATSVSIPSDTINYICVGRD